jgi:hypothetical protein
VSRLQMTGLIPSGDGKSLLLAGFGSFGWECDR